jgi:hypothetical protein
MIARRLASMMIGANRADDTSGDIGGTMSNLRTRLLAAACGGALALGGALVTAPQAQALGPAQARACTSSDSYYAADEFLLPTYETIGNTVGKYNASPGPSTLSYAETTTVSKATQWNQEVGVSGEFNAVPVLSIAKVTVSARIGHSVTDTVSKGVTVTDTLTVPGSSYGYVTPTVQRQKYVITYHRVLANCAERVSQVGLLEAIVASPMFLECVGTAPCRPSAPM